MIMKISTLILAACVLQLMKKMFWLEMEQSGYLACGRWLHEDCVEECMVDKDQREHYCPDILSAHTWCYL